MLKDAPGQRRGSGHTRPWGGHKRPASLPPPGLQRARWLTGMRWRGHGGHVCSGTKALERRGRAPPPASGAFFWAPCPSRRGHVHPFSSCPPRRPATPWPSLQLPSLQDLDRQDLHSPDPKGTFPILDTPAFPEHPPALAPRSVPCFTFSQAVLCWQPLPQILLPSTSTGQAPV